MKALSGAKRHHLPVEIALVLTGKVRHLRIAGDAVLAISFAPYASETVSLSQAAAARGVPIVSITDSPFSPLAQIAGLWIEVGEANFEGFRSMAATLSLAMTLTVAVAEKREQAPVALPRIGGA